MLHLAVQVLMLSCGLRQILAGDLTRGGLLSFLLFQEDVGHHVQVRQPPRMLSPSLCFSLCLWPWDLLVLLKNTRQNETPAHCCVRKNLKHTPSPPPQGQTIMNRVFPSPTLTRISSCPPPFISLSPAPPPTVF